jgi:hypothetical protein
MRSGKYKDGVRGVAMTDEQPKLEEKTGTYVSGTEVIILVLFTPIVLTWIFLSARIIISATSNPDTLNNLEPLLLGLSIITQVVVLGFTELWKRYAARD